ncbi:hypothetical protein CTA2_5015 [Colletotrichum tanaceti]|nr:hypothetical protein CTA2_5015 [Colletotrichum tanaceti]
MLTRPHHIRAGLAFHSIATLLIANTFIASSRPYTSKVFTLLYHNPATNKYGAGHDDLCFVASCVMHLGIPKTKDVIRFSEQGWMLAYYSYLDCKSPYHLGMKELWTDWPKQGLDVRTEDEAEEEKEDDGEEEEEEEEEEERVEYEMVEALCVEKDVGVESINWRAWERRNARWDTGSKATGARVHGQSHQKDLRNRIGCEMQILSPGEKLPWQHACHASHSPRCASREARDNAGFLRRWRGTWE